MLDCRLKETCFSDLSVRVANVSSSPEVHLLGNRTIHVWSVDLREFRQHRTVLEAILSNQERERVVKCHFPSDREHYILCRGLLRWLLSHYLDCPPTELKFSYGTMGKPELTGRILGGPVHFNISHSANWALFAITRACPVGVDVEQLSPLDFLEFAASFFSPQEVESLRALPTDEQITRFYALWACKEALMKATGEGINDTLKCLQVLFTHGERPRCSYASAWQQGAEWQLRVLHPAPDYVGAIAFRQNGLDLVTQRLRA